MALLAILEPLSGRQTPQCRADEWIELTIPLRNGQEYRRGDFRREAQRKLGIPAVRAKSMVESAAEPADEWVEFTRHDRLALDLAELAGLLQYEANDERLLLRVPNSQDDAVRRRTRKRLESLFGGNLSEWPAGTGLHIPPDFEPDQPTAVLIHGLESNAEAMSDVAELCRASGVQPVLFDYPNDGPIAWSGERLSADLKAFAKTHPGQRLAIIAHSMGGLVARHCLETPGLDPGCISDLVMLATPHRGSQLARAYEWLALICDTPPLGSSFYAGLQDGLGEAAEDLLPDSEFLRALNANERPKTVRYFVAAGRKSFLASDDLAVLRDAIGSPGEDTNLAARIPEEIRDLLAADELADGRGDGAVSVESATNLPAESTRVFDLNHEELLHAGVREPEGAVAVWLVETLQWTNQEQ